MGKKRILLLIILISGIHFQSFSQNMGVSFSFFFPKNGEFSMPVSPFSYRGVALPFNDYFGLQTGISIYRMGGLSFKNYEFESKKPEYGPNLTAYVPLELYLSFQGKSASLTLKGGVFGFYGVFNKLNYGNIDRAIKEQNGWDLVNADYTFRNLPGWGYQGGIEYLHQVNRKFALTFEINYLMGGAKLGLEGTYTGGNVGSIQTYNLNSPDARLDLTGLEISIGGVM